MVINTEIFSGRSKSLPLNLSLAFVSGRAGYPKRYTGVLEAYWVIYMLAKRCSQLRVSVAVLAVTPSPFRRYLYFEYNEIHEVDPGTFDAMPSLQLLFLNANLLRSLPTGVFSRVNLARLNLRNNHFLQLPVAGVLEHLTGLVQVGPSLLLALLSNRH